MGRIRMHFVNTAYGLIELARGVFRTDVRSTVVQQELAPVQQEKRKWWGAGARLQKRARHNSVLSSMNTNFLHRKRLL